MRKLLAVILAVLFVISGSVAFAENVDLSAMTDEELRTLGEAIDAELANRQAAAALASGVIAEGDVGEYHVAILSVEKTTDYASAPSVIVTYMFTNNSAEDTMFMSAIEDKVYHNGVQCETAIIMNGSIDSTASMMSIRPGASLEVEKGYVLRDGTNVIEIEVGKLFDFSSKPAKIIATVEIPE